MANTSSVHIALEVESDGQNIRIVQVNEGGQLSTNIRPLDCLMAVNGHGVQGKSADEVQNLLSGIDGSEVTLSFSRPSDAGAGERSCKAIRTSTPEVDRQVATMRMFQQMLETGEDQAYYRPSSTPDGKAFAAVCTSIKELRSKAGVDGDFLGIGSGVSAVTKLISDPVMGLFGGGGSEAAPTGTAAAKETKGLSTEVLVLRLGQGDYFGEIALVANKPRQATVKAFGSATVLVMSRDAFTRLCGPLMDILKRNLDNYSSIELPSPEEVAGPGKTNDSITFAEQPEHQEEKVERKPRTGRSRRKSVFVESVSLEEDWEPPVFEKSSEEKDRLAQHISKTALLASLDTKARDTVIMAVQKQSIKKGENVIVQGDDGDYFYILDVGAADVLIKQADGSELKVLDYKPGGSFGELALLHGEPRLATVRATEESTVWKLDRDTFRKIMMSTGKQSMDERTKFLNNVSILGDLSTFEKFKVAESMEVRTFQDNEVIVQEGDEGHEFFVIQSGNCHCFKKTLDV